MPVNLSSDVNGDGIVDGNDLTAIVGRLGAALGDYSFLPSADLNGDGVINALDLELMRAKIASQPAEIIHTI